MDHISYQTQHTSLTEQSSLHQEIIADGFDGEIDTMNAHMKKKSFLASLQQRDTEMLAQHHQTMNTDVAFLDLLGESSLLQHSYHDIVAQNQRHIECTDQLESTVVTGTVLCCGIIPIIQSLAQKHTTSDALIQTVRTTINSPRSIQQYITTHGLVLSARETQFLQLLNHGSVFAQSLVTPSKPGSPSLFASLTNSLFSDQAIVCLATPLSQSTKTQATMPGATLLTKTQQTRDRFSRSWAGGKVVAGLPYAIAGFVAYKGISSLWRRFRQRLRGFFQPVLGVFGIKKPKPTEQPKPSFLATALATYGFGHIAYRLFHHLGLKDISQDVRTSATRFDKRLTQDDFGATNRKTKAMMATLLANVYVGDAVDHSHPSAAEHTIPPSTSDRITVHKTPQQSTTDANLGIPTTAQVDIHKNNDAICEDIEDDDSTLCVDDNTGQDDTSIDITLSPSTHSSSPTVAPIQPDHPVAQDQTIEHTDHDVLPEHLQSQLSEEFEEHHSPLLSALRVIQMGYWPQSSAPRTFWGRFGDVLAGDMLMRWFGKPHQWIHKQGKQLLVDEKKALESIKAGLNGSSTILTTYQQQLDDVLTASKNQKTFDASTLDKKLTNMISSKRSLVQKFLVLRKSPHTDPQAIEKTQQTITSLNEEIQQLHNEATQALAELDTSSQDMDKKAAQKKAFTLTEKYNALLAQKEAHILLQLSVLPADHINKLAAKNKAVATLVDLNGKVDTFVATNKAARRGGKAATFVVGAQLLGLVSSGGISGAQAADMALGFIPGYDLGVALWGQAPGSDKPLTAKERKERLFRGVIGCVPAVGRLTKAAKVGVKGAKIANASSKTVQAAEIATQTAHLVGKLATYGYLGLTLYQTAKPLSVSAFHIASSSLNDFKDYYQPLDPIVTTTDT